MEGDLSLSQSFGGLRIANPDDSLPPQNEYTSSRPQAQQQPHQLSQSRTYHDQTQTQTQTQNHPPAPFPQNLPQDLTSIAGKPIHPSSPEYPSHESLSNPAALPYRIRGESTASSKSENGPRSDSRPVAAALQPRASVRDIHRNDVQYQSRTPSTGPNGPILPRGSSRGLHNSSAAPSNQTSPYNIEGGPPMSSEEWQERGAAVSLRQEIDPSGRTISRYVKKGVRDFSFGRTLGEGSYSTVIAATDRQTLKEYAIKILDKRHIIKEKKVKYVNIEKDTLNRLTDHPGVVRLYYTFQDERSLYFVLDLASGGELLGVLKRMTSFDEECTRFYGAQILDTIDYMHKRGVIHRDLKPENVLLDSHMHVKITDFGTAKILDSTRRMDDGGNGIPHMGSPESNQDRASSFVGTAEYVSPELLTDKNACKASDLWAFGCIIYQLLSGRPPFKGGNEYQTFQKIVALDYEFPMGFPPVARDLVERLLVLDPASRLQIEHVKNHEFFDGITWGRGLWKQKAPRLKPYAPPPPEPIKLNGGSNGDSFPPNINKSSHLAAQNIVGSSRPYPRIITDLPPPSQLDIEWSPVLTSSNERILKMGNLTVSAAPLPGGGHSRGGNGDHEGPKLLSRFFGGATTKKRPRLVLVTTCGRVVVVPAGGDDKRPKLDIPLLSPDVQYRSTTDMKGHSSFIIDTRERRYVFEEGKHASDGTSALSVQEWVDTLDRAKETAAFHANTGNPYATEDGFRDLSSGVSSHSNTLNQSEQIPLPIHPAEGGRNALVKHQPGGGDSDSVKGRKRFSRQSKNGLSAIF